MDKEEDIKLKIFNTINMKNNTKKKYFRIEKNKIYYKKENKSKAIFKTKKDLLNRKTFREIENSKSNKNNKFITTTIDDTTASMQSDNSFLVQKIIPKKLPIKENKNETDLKNFSKSNDNILIIMNERKNFFHNLFEIENNENNSNNIDIDNYKHKLMFVYFYSIKNLCKYINKNLFNISFKENKIIDEYLYQIYQDLQILNRKINEFKLFYNIKDNLKINKEDFIDIYSLKENLLLMKNILNNSMSQNLINIYINIENFCRIYSS
jgi:hypothetical protein